MITKRIPAAMAAGVLSAALLVTGCTGERPAESRQESVPAESDRSRQTQEQEKPSSSTESSESSSTKSSESSSSSDGVTRFSPDDILEKPVLYLYPEAETEVSVALGHPERLTAEYPAYGDGWDVVARPDGTLVDMATGRGLYALYYEASSTVPEAMTPEGFVVARDGLVPFLEEKLDLLGLTEREAEEMIVYWLPRMQSSPYCYVRFSLTEAEQEENRLDISPKPDHLVRIRMIWKGLDEPTDGIREQGLTPVDRDSLSGFVAVEWGGTEIGSAKTE